MKGPNCINKCPFSVICGSLKKGGLKSTNPLLTTERDFFPGGKVVIIVICISLAAGGCAVMWLVDVDVVIFPRQH